MGQEGGGGYQHTKLATCTTSPSSNSPPLATPATAGCCRRFHSLWARPAARERPLCWAGGPPRVPACPPGALVPPPDKRPCGPPNRRAGTRAHSTPPRGSESTAAPRQLYHSVHSDRWEQAQRRQRLCWSPPRPHPPHPHCHRQRKSLGPLRWLQLPGPCTLCGGRTSACADTRGSSRRGPGSHHSARARRRGRSRRRRMTTCAVPELRGNFETKVQHFRRFIFVDYLQAYKILLRRYSM